MLRIPNRLVSKSLGLSSQIRYKATTPISHIHDYGTVDGAFEKDRIKKIPGQANSRDFTYFVLGGTRVIYASAARLALIKVIFLSNKTI